MVNYRIYGTLQYIVWYTTVYMVNYRIYGTLQYIVWYTTQIYRN